ncbi:hypothetical protein N2152v2_001025 [Parachlorella kessleri]
MGRNSSRTQLLQKPSRFAVVSDLDWTMVNHNDVIHEDLLRFNRLWVSEFGHDSLLVFSTGRSPELFKELADEVPLLTPNILVCSVGTEILIDGEPDEEWEAFLNQGWDRAKAAEIAKGLPDLKLQQPSEQRPHKISYKLHAPSPQQADEVISTLRSQLEAAGLETNVVYSAGVDVDILPSRASKGKALAFLLQQLDSAGGRPSSGVLVCGDSGNDVELFAVAGVHGCMVANAHSELRDWCEEHGTDKLFKATADGPGGILQAIEHFGFAKTGGAPAAETLLRQELVHLHELVEAWLGATTPRGAPDALPTHLEQLLGAEYEHVTSDGTLLSREQLLAWWREGRYGCEGNQRCTAPDPRSQPPNDAPAVEEEGGDPGVKPASSTHRYRVWLDRFNAREVGPGLWLARYVEVHQPFTAGAHTHDQRTACLLSVLLRQEEDGTGGFKVLTSHETRVPLGAHRQHSVAAP